MTPLDAYGAALTAIEAVGRETLAPAEARPILDRARDALPGVIDDDAVPDWLAMHGFTTMLGTVLANVAEERDDFADVKGLLAQLAELSTKVTNLILDTGPGRALERLTTLAVAIGGWSPY